MTHPAPSPPLPLARIQRLLRPLRSSLSSLHSTLLSTSNSTSTALTNSKGKATATIATNGDEEYGAPSRNKKRKVARSSTSSVPSSSPFRSLRPTSGAGNRRMMRVPIVTYSTSASNSSSRHVPPPPPSPVRRRISSPAPIPLPIPPKDPRTALLASGFTDSILLLKILAFLKAFGSVLESCSLRSDSVDGVKSLVRIVSEEIGWGIEESLIRFEEDDEEDGKGAAEVEEDNMILVQEWYECVPAYCTRWILAQHASFVVINALEELGEMFPSYGQFSKVVETVFDVCLTWSAISEATRVYALLCTSSLQSSTSSHKTTSSRSCSNLLSISRRLSSFGSSGQTNLFKTMKATLLSSSFAERFFFSEFISIKSSSKLLIKEDSDFLVKLLGLKCSVAGDMIVAIIGAIDDLSEDDESQAEDGNRLILEILSVVSDDVLVALPLILSDLGCSKQVKGDLFELVRRIPKIGNLAGVLKVIDLNFLENEELVRDGSELESLEELIRIQQEQHEDEEERDEDDVEDLIARFLIPRLSTRSLARISVILHSAGFYDLERQTLDAALDKFSELNDVKWWNEGSKIGYNPLGEPLELEVFERMRDDITLQPSVPTSPIKMTFEDYFNTSPPPAPSTDPEYDSKEIVLDSDDDFNPVKFEPLKNRQVKDFLIEPLLPTSEPDDLDLLAPPPTSSQLLRKRKKREENKVRERKVRTRVVRFEGLSSSSSLGSASTMMPSEDELTLC